MKKLIHVILIMIFLASCAGQKSETESKEEAAPDTTVENKMISEEQLKKVVKILEGLDESEDIEALDNYGLTEAELELGKCARECRRTYRFIKPPKIIQVAEVDAEGKKILGVKYSRERYRNSDNLYNAHMTAIITLCAEGCNTGQPYADKVIEQTENYYTALHKLAEIEAKNEKEQAEQTEEKDKKNST